ncbi:MAG: Ig-like domain-containing protein, partial [Chloroflexi bacterium]|nr:Ig-like domain-containing protein [Chloroflexota bacterium]
MPLRFDQSRDYNLGSLRHYCPYLLVFVLLLVSSACSFPSGETETPTPSPSQEIVERATATFPAIPTPTPQSLPPDLVESDPFPNSEVGLDGSLKFYFNQAMDQTSVEEAFSGLSGRFNWLDDSTLIFTPNQPLTPSAQLDLQFDTQAQAANGLQLVEPINLVYYAVGYLYLTQSLPEDGSTAVEPSSAIVATFNRPVVPLAADQSTLPPAFTLEPNAEGRSEWINTSTYVFSPETSLAGGTEYTVKLNNDLTGVDGSPLQIPQAWSFTTADPRLLSVEPVDGAVNVSLDSDVLLTFNQPMEPDSVVDEFTMLEANNTRIRGEFTWNDDTTEFTFTPDNLLKRDRVYSIELSEVTLSGGGTQIGSEYQSTFKTIPELAVIRSDPGDNGQKEIYSSIAIEFNSPINFKNVLQFVKLNPQISNLEAFVDEEERTIWLSGYYEPDTAYTLTISPNLPDKWNGRLGQEFILNFGTKPFDPSLVVATGSDVIFLTPEQSSITVQVTNLNDITYSLGEV